MLSQQAFATMSDKSQDHYIRLLYHIKQCKSLWFWQRWFQTSECKERVADLGKSLGEIDNYLEKVEMCRLLTSVWNYGKQVYEKCGGR